MASNRKVFSSSSRGDREHEAMTEQGLFPAYAPSYPDEIGSIADLAHPNEDIAQDQMIPLDEDPETISIMAGEHDRGNSANAMFAELDMRHGMPTVYAVRNMILSGIRGTGVGKTKNLRCYYCTRGLKPSQAVPLPVPGLPYLEYTHATCTDKNTQGRIWGPRNRGR